jgi:RHS repeat-associated protein
VPDENPSGLGVFEYPGRFPGQYFDKETNLSYNYFRDCFDPATGRYCQSDPIGLRGGINTYAYAKSKPLMLIDADGLQASPPPPVEIPGGPYKWSPDPGNSRGGSFKGPNGASASWDPTGDHWDVDDGKGNRQRYNRHGSPITKKEAHSKYKGPKRLPLLFRNFSLLMCIPMVDGYCDANPGDPACAVIGRGICDVNPDLCLDV